VDEGDGIDDAEQWQILEGLPTNIGALKGKLRRVPDMGLKERGAEGPPAPASAEAGEPARPEPKHRPLLAWVAEQAGKIAVTVIGGLVLAGILFLLKG
jgi:hypothetical protein